VAKTLSNPKDFASGLMFLGIGLAFALVAYFTYPMGKGARMGPGYFPFWIGVLLAVLGAVITLKSLRTTGEAIGSWALKAMFWVVLAIVLFGLLLRPLGMVGAGLILIVLASIPSGEFKWKEVALLAAVMVVMCASIFVYGLKLPIPLWPSFLG
jgi:Tripartite tricarboxylate transporter TctB family